MYSGSESSVKGRAALALWLSFWLMSLVVVTTYSGNLVAALTANDVRLPFNTLEELAADTEYPLMVRYGNAQMGLMQVRTYIALLWF